MGVVADDAEANGPSIGLDPPKYADTRLSGAFTLPSANSANVFSSSPVPEMQLYTIKRKSNPAHATMMINSVLQKFVSASSSGSEVSSHK